MTELLLETQLKPSQREDVEMIRLSAGSLLSVINDVLDFAEIESGKLELDNQPFALRDNFGSAMKPYSLRAHQKGLELVYDVHPTVPDDLLGDPIRLRQLLVNLVDNAIKFTEQGTIVVSIDLESTGAADSRTVADGKSCEQEVRLHCAVSDPGIGIPPEKQIAIFEPFTQADGSSTRRFGGSGLGLTICSRLVEKMGGRIWVESGAARQGSVFHFTATVGLQNNGEHTEPLPDLTPVKALMINRPEETVAVSDYDDVPEDESEAHGEAPLKILLAEDNLVNQKLAMRLLEKRGHRVKAAKDGWEALAALNREGFDLVLMDIDMPEMDGFEATRAIRQQEKITGGHLLIMAMTAHAMKGDEQRCLSAGMDAYVPKPIDPSEMFYKIRKLRHEARFRRADYEFAGSADSR